jgi:hypothetical protein
MCIRPIHTIAILLLPFAASAALGAQPKVVTSVPETGQIGVDPSLKEIRISFDQPMGQGTSVVGGGEAFPELQDRPRWADARTVVLSVKLRPNHSYWLSINNEQFRNFTNPAGEPAEPYPIQFRTGPGTGADKQATTGSHLRAVGLLRSAIRDHYSYRDRLNVDWDTLVGKHESLLAAATSPTDFAQMAATLMSRAQDKHILFRVGNESIPSYIRPMVPNANGALLARLVPNLKNHGRAVASGRWDDGVGYLAIPTWDRAALDGGNAVFDALDELRDTRALVIDVRANGGGDERIAQELVGCFVAERRLYAKNVYRDPVSQSGFTAPRERWVEPNATRPRYEGRVAVLSGPVVMSSCESFLMMMKCVPGAVIVGAPSQGSSGNPRPHDLGNGVTVLLPSWKDLTPGGAELEGIGVPPDIKIATSPNDFQSIDPVLATALAHLREP